MDRWANVVGAVVVAVAVLMLGLAVYTVYEEVGHGGSRLKKLQTPIVLTSSGPVASFSWASQGYNVTFTDTSTTNGSTITSWVWDFGDGSPVYRGAAPPPHTFTTTCPSCSFQVSLAVRDATGAQAATSTPVRVEHFGSSSGSAQSSNSANQAPDLGPATSGLLAALELALVMILIGVSTARAGWNLLSQEPKAVEVPYWPRASRNR